MTNDGIPFNTVQSDIKQIPCNAYYYAFLSSLYLIALEVTFSMRKTATLHSIAESLVINKN